MIEKNIQLTLNLRFQTFIFYSNIPLNYMCFPNFHFLMSLCMSLVVYQSKQLRLAIVTDCKRLNPLQLVLLPALKSSISC